MGKTFEELRPEDLIAMRKNATKEEVLGEKYVPVKLSSMGKLGLPAVVHVRDYSYSDALKLASATTTTEVVKAITEVIANVVQEDNIDLSKLTSQDVLEILMTIQGTWYSPTMEFPYYVDEELPEDKRDDKSNISKAVISINSIRTKPFPEGKNVPLTVNMDKTFTATVDIPRFYDEVIVSQYIENKYAEQDNKMENLSRKIEESTNTVEEYREYMAYREARTSDLIRATQAIQILSVNGKELKTLEERIQAMNEFPLRAWSAVTSYIQKELDFGVIPEVTFNCTVTGKRITRRFSFRVLDFLPTMESLNNAGAGISIC